jgi:aryl-alcohol dehydrogenase-like predicted oxidoreductase
MLGINGFCCEQPPYNLFDRRIERELLPFLRTYEWACIPWSPLAGGQLSGKYLLKEQGRARYGQSDPMNRVTAKTIEKTRQLKRIADRLGISMTTLSLAWVAQQPGITSPIIGARTIKQLEDSANACQYKRPDKALKQIDAVCAPNSHLINYYSAPFGPNRRPVV